MPSFDDIAGGIQALLKIALALLILISIPGWIEDMGRYDGMTAMEWKEEYVATADCVYGAENADEAHDCFEELY